MIDIVIKSYQFYTTSEIKELVHLEDIHLGFFYSAVSKLITNRM